MENIKKHNEMVKENIEKLSSTVNDYINSHPNISEAEVAQLAESLTKQLDRAHTQMIDLSSDSGKQYVDELMKKRKSSSGSSGSTKKKSTSTVSANQVKTSAPQTQYGVRESPIQQQLKEKKAAGASSHYFSEAIANANNTG